MKILIIEDDSTIRSSLKYCLEAEGYEIEESSTANESLKKINSSDLILLDVNLPDKSGFELLPEIKKIKNVPIIFLTANDLETSIVMGLDMGADDYITKPFRTRELISRIKNVLRRSTQIQDKINIKNITIDLQQAKVFKNNQDLGLTAIEYKILLILAINRNQILSREKILASIWDVNEEYVYDNTLTVYIKRIREKIEDNPSNPQIIETIRSQGYRIGD